MLYQLNISTKNLNTLKRFLNVLETIKTKPYLTKIKMFESNKNKKSVYFTILKSPHVNKTAREQLGYEIYSKVIYIYTDKIELFSTIFKKLKSNLFYDISFKISFLK